MSYGEQSRLRTGRIHVARREEKLFTESFIYRRQIDSLSDQSVRTSQEATPASLRRRSFSTISLPSVGLAGSRTRLRFLPPRLRVPRRNKQLLSTFRSAKWEKAVGVQLATSLTGFARISTTEM